MVEMERWADIIVFQGYLMHEHPSLRHSKKVVVVDVYDPFHLEQLEQARDLGEEARRNVVASATGVLNEQLERGDFFMCASDKQRDFWLGQLAALGRVNPAVYDDDESLGSFISVVPFGVGNEPPRKTAPGMRGVIDGIGQDDKIVLWGGGIYNWFDPITLIRAIARARDRVPNIRLVFMGVKHPNPAVPQMRMAVDAERVADELGLLGTHVFFNRQWVAYKDRQNFLLEADIGVSTHLDHVETAFSFRTRILDYLWATLPIVCTQGDSLATLVSERDLGATVPPLDIDALADAMVTILTDPETVARHKANIVQVAEAYRWERTLAPLVAFCRNPRRSADVSTRTTDTGGFRPVGVVEPRWGGVTGDVRLVGEYLRDGGPRLLVHKVASRVRRLALGRPAA
jgi:glycosyltransferase involved in cell wall biosynthesis